MLALKNRFLQTSAALYCWVACTSTALAIDLGEVPSELSGGEGEDIGSTVASVVVDLLTLMALVATIVIIIAGVRLVVSQGEESAVEKAKKTIIWAIVGLILIILAGAIVEFVSSAAGGGE